MKRRDESFVEQWLEKIVMGVAGLFFLVVMFFFFVGSPYKVKIDGLGDEKIAPRDIPGRIKDEADDLASRLNRPVDAKTVVVPDFAGDFGRRMSEPLVTLAGDRFPVPLSGVGLGRTVMAGADQRRTYAMTDPPPPTDLKVRADYAVLLDNEDIEEEMVIRHPELDASKARMVARMVVNRYENRLGRETPRDFRYVSVSAVFDKDRWVDRLLDTDEDQRVPDDWWKGVLAFTDVVLERETLDSATNKWGERVTIDPLPDSRSFRSVPNEFNREEAFQIVQEIKTFQDQIIKPDFAPIAEYKPWLPPGADKQLTQKEQILLSKIFEDLKKNQGHIDRTESIMDRRQQMDERRRRDAERTSERTARTSRPVARERSGRDSRRERRSSSSRQRRTESRRRPSSASSGGGYGLGGGPGGIGSGGGTGGGLGLGPGRSRQQDEGDSMQALDDRLRKLHEDRDGLLIARDEIMLKLEPDQTQVRGRSRRSRGRAPRAAEGQMMGMPSRAYGPPGMGMPGMGMPGMGMPGMGGGRGLSSRQRTRSYRRIDPRADRRTPADDMEEDVAPSNLVTVWAHDVTTQPGMTYRYRVQVSLINPLFQRPMLAEEQQDWFNKLSILSDPSDWSEPVTVDPIHHFFLVADSRPRSTVEVEVFTVYDGVWQSETFRVQPGDLIGGTVDVDVDGGKTSLDLSVGCAVVDLDFDVVHDKDGLKTTTTEMLYLDVDTGQLGRRTVAADRGSEILRRLRLEQKIDFRQARADQMPL